MHVVEVESVGEGEEVTREVEPTGGLMARVASTEGWMGV